MVVIGLMETRLNAVSLSPRRHLQLLLHHLAPQFPYLSASYFHALVVLFLDYQLQYHLFLELQE